MSSTAEPVSKPESDSAGVDRIMLSVESELKSTVKSV